MVTITLTDDDIFKGDRCSTGNCPVARAVIRLFGVSEVYLSPYRLVCRTRSQQLLSVRLAPAAKCWIANYDRCDNLGMLTFQLLNDPYTEESFA